MKTRSWIGPTVALSCLGVALLFGAAPASAATDPSAVAKSKIVDAFGKLPISFEPNQGQADRPVQFLARGKGFRLLLTSTEVVLDLRQAKAPEGGARLQPMAAKVAKRFAADQAQDLAGSVVRMKLVGGDPDARVTGLQKLRGTVNYLRGNDPAKWRTGIPTYARVQHKDVYPGIDLVFYGNQQKLEYDLVVAPGADPKVVALDFDGADRLEIDARGDLVIHAAGLTVRQHKPVAYQPIGSAMRPVPVSYVLKGDRQVGFAVDRYHASLPLVIDPVLDLAAGPGIGDFVVTDPAGNIYVTGFVPFFPPDPQFGLSDVFVAKLDPAGTKILWQTILGGDGSDFANGIVRDSSGFLYLTGSTNSTNFPTFPTPSTPGNPVQAAFGGGVCNGITGAMTTPTDPSAIPCPDIFVVKLDETKFAGDGSAQDAAAIGAVVYSTYLGGSAGDFATSLTVDTGGNAYVTGAVGTDNNVATTKFPLTILTAAQTIYGGGISDAFVVKLGPTGTLLYSSYHGGKGDDSASGITLDSSGNVVLTGETFGTVIVALAPPLEPTLVAAREDPAAEWPTVIEETFMAAASSVVNDFPINNALQPSYGGGFCNLDGLTDPAGPIACPDAFVARFSSLGSRLYSSYLGGTGADFGIGIGVDAGDNVYIAGATSSPSGIITAADPSTFDSFVAKLAPPTTPTAPASLVYTVPLGGNGTDLPTSIAVTPTGSVFVAVTTDSTTSATALPPSTSGSTELVIVQLVAPSASTAPPAIATISLGEAGIDSGSTLGLTVDPAGNVVVAGASDIGLGVKLTNSFVAIDVRPGKSPNNVNLKSKGKIKVAILSTATLDAPTQVDRTSLTFGRTGDEPSLVDCKKDRKDVNKDGRRDLVCRFSTRTAGFQSGDTQATLKGKTLGIDGTDFIGIDQIRIVPIDDDDDD